MHKWIYDSSKCINAIPMHQYVFGVSSSVVEISWRQSWLVQTTRMEEINQNNMSFAQAFFYQNFYFSIWKLIQIFELHEVDVFVSRWRLLIVNVCSWDWSWQTTVYPVLSKCWRHIMQPQLTSSRNIHVLVWVPLTSGMNTGLVLGMSTPSRL